MPKTHPTTIDYASFDPQHLAADLIALRIDRTSIERHDVQPVLDVLNRLVASESVASHLEGKLLVSIDGYDSDTRELYELPQVLAFCRMITKHWPYWFHFVHRGASALDLVFLTHFDVERVSRLPGADRCVLRSHEQMATELRRLFDGMNCLYDRFGWCERRNMQASEAVFQALNRWLGV